MKVKIENGKLGQVIDLLFNMGLKGTKSRHRTKIVNLMKKHLEDVAEQETALLKEHCHLNEDGEPMTTNNGQTWDVKDIESFRKDKLELLAEEFVIEGSNYEDAINTVKIVLLECEQEFSGNDAALYDYACNQFENGDEE